MSYLVLARKHRPQTFADVVGQQLVVRILRNGLARNRVAHAMIFSGVRGVGKTTLARIMAKALNCQSESDVKPCDQCESCQEIRKGSAVDLHEIDGASNRGIQEIRELKENIRFFPVKSSYKIIIIDEVHMLTTEAFNALLKTLEEPPEHVFFMFATTEIHKVPLTILSRCQRLELTRVGQDELAGFFRRIAGEEGVTVSEEALALIAREADGSVRDGLSLLDQIFSFAGSEVEARDVVQVLGLVDREVFVDLARCLLAGDLAQSLTLLDNSYAAGLDLKRFAADLLGCFRSLLVCRTCAEARGMLAVTDNDFTRLSDLAADYSQETLARYFQLLLQGMEKMQYSARPRLMIELAFIRMVQAGEIEPASVLLQRLEEVIGDGSIADAAPLKKKIIERPSSPLEGDKPVPEPVKPKAPPAPAPAPAPATQVVRDWAGFADYVKDRKPWMGQVLRLAENPGEVDSELLIKFANASDGKLLATAENMKFLTEYAQDFFQRELRLRVVTGDVESADNDDDKGSPQEERRALANDPLVQVAADVFNGRVAAIRTGPRFRQ